MSLNSIAEIKAFIEAIPAGEPIFNIYIGYRSSLDMTLEDWPEKMELIKSTDLLKKYIGNGIERGYDISSRKLFIKSNTIYDSLPHFIKDKVVELCRLTSICDQPKRTNAYKEMVEIAYVNQHDEAFQNDILPIINYYYKVQADSINKQDMVVHNNNVQALLNILRKKYGKSIRRNN